MAALNYTTVGSNDLERAKGFYDPLMEAIGLRSVMDHPEGGRFYGGGKAGLFAVMRPYDKASATVGNGNMAGFAFDTREEVSAFHAKALELGAVNEGDPGERGPGLYFAYFRDPDGNKLCGYKLG
jgi:catechol 2,3-dioxygenase-like lactoylglutathione lyase family enzyme